MTVLDEETYNDISSNDTGSNDTGSNDIITPRLDVRKIIENNNPIDDHLNVIMVISNPCNYKKRYKLAREFIARMMAEPMVHLYIVEMVYLQNNSTPGGGASYQEFAVTTEGNPMHLQLRAETPLWHKENMINLGVKYLLPTDWRAFAWIDADVEFENPRWVEDSLRILTRCSMIQLFSHAIDMNYDESVLSIFNGFCYQQARGFEYCGIRGANYWHPGFAWAITREAYEQLGGLFELGILGSGDYNMAMALIGRGEKSFTSGSNDVFKQLVMEKQLQMHGFISGYTPGVCKHYFHGQKKNRKYSERWKILSKYDYNPYLHVMHDPIGILLPTADMPRAFIDDIMQYFSERNEDDFSC